MCLRISSLCCNYCFDNIPMASSTILVNWSNFSSSRSKSQGIHDGFASRTCGALGRPPCSWSGLVLKTQSVIIFEWFIHFHLPLSHRWKHPWQVDNLKNTQPEHPEPRWRTVEVLWKEYRCDENYLGDHSDQFKSWGRFVSRFFGLFLTYAQKDKIFDCTLCRFWKTKLLCHSLSRV